MIRVTLRDGWKIEIDDAKNDEPAADNHPKKGNRNDMIKRRLRGGYINPPRQTQTAHNFSSIYKSDRWKKLVSAIKLQRGSICEDKEHEHDKPMTNIDADHVVELQDGGAAFDPRNILLRCRSCHVRKTNRKKADRHAAEWWAKRAREEQGG